MQLVPEQVSFRRFQVSVRDRRHLQDRVRSQMHVQGPTTYRVFSILRARWSHVVNGKGYHFGQILIRRDERGPESVFSRALARGPIPQPEPRSCSPSSPPPPPLGGPEGGPSTPPPSHLFPSVSDVSTSPLYIYPLGGHTPRTCTHGKDRITPPFLLLVSGSVN